MKNNHNGVDVFSPILEIFHELCLLIIKIIGGMIACFCKKILGWDQIEKIDRKLLSVKKVTKNVLAFGIDTKTKKEIPLSSIDFSHHSFIVGASGFGKTNLLTIVQEHYLRNGFPIVFIDPKGDLEALTTFKRLCESYGKKCHVFSESYEESVLLNPVLDGSITQVVDRIMCSFDWTEPYYEDMSNRALRATLSDLLEREKDFSLKHIYDVLVSKHDKKETSGLIVKLENIVKSDFGKLLSGSKDDYTLKKICQERSCLYIGISTQGYGKMAMGLGKIFLGELMFNSYQKLNSSFDSMVNKSNPIAVIFDEFGAVVTPRFIELLNKCRGAGMQLTMAVQSTSDISRVDSDLTIQVMENCANWFILKQRISSSAEMLSQAIGTVLTKKHTDMTENGEKAGRGTEREVHELVVHPDLIKNLKIGQCILLRQNPHKINLINIRKRLGGELIKKQYKNIQLKEVF